MPLDPSVEKAMLAAVPGLHGFALTLCRRADRADDLVQEALLHAIDKIESFRPGTNMTAWLDPAQQFLQRMAQAPARGVGPR